MIRFHELKIGDKFTIKCEKIMAEYTTKLDVKIGVYLSYYQHNNTFQPYNHESLISQGKFIITKINYQQKQWWEFWKKRKINDIQVECVKL